MTSTDMKIGANLKSANQAFCQAEAGVRFAMVTIKAGLKADPPSFTLPTSTDPDDAGHSVSLTYNLPSGFSFVISDITKVAANTYSFKSTGSGPDNSKAAITVTFSTTGPFSFAAFGQIGVAMSGNGFTDSYNSSEGPYTWATRGTNGDVGTNSTAARAITLSGRVRVYGDAQVGPGGDPETGIRKSGRATVTGQESAADELKDMTPLTLPNGGRRIPPWIISSGGKRKDIREKRGKFRPERNISPTSNTLSSGTYRTQRVDISGTGIIEGDVILYVEGNIKISGNGRIKIKPGGSLTIYAAGPISISGSGGITNSTFIPENLQIYGTSTCTQIAMSGNASMYGAIYAPSAAVAMSGNGSIYGSVVARYIAMSGNGNIHYDEALATVGSGTDLKLLSWREDM